MGRPRIHPQTGVTLTAFRIPNKLKDQVNKLAEKEHWTFNQAIIEAVKLLIKSKTVSAE